MAFSFKMTSEDDKMKKMVEQIEAGKKYKVLTQEDYDALLAINANKNLGAVGGVPSITHINTPTSSTPSVSKPDVRPKFGFPFPGPSPIPRLQQMFNNSQPLNTSFVAPSYSQPKLPIFSGQDDPPKGEVTYEVWSFEVKCLQNSHYLPEHVLLQSIRHSLKGSARSIIVPLGETATVADILQKLDVFFGNVSSCETLMQNFYSDYQKDKESIVQYGSRLEQTLSRAIQFGHMDNQAKDAMLRTKFWTGLNSQQLKNSTRHLFDSIKDFQLLLKEIRKVEQEDACSNRPAGKPKVAQQHSGQASNEPDSAQLLKQMSDLMERMKVMEKKLDSQQQVLSSKQFSSSDSHYYQQFDGSQFNRDRGRGYSRGFNRGYNRGASRGRGYGRGFQNFNTDDSSQSNGGGSFRAGNRGRANGRGTGRGGSARGGHSLN